MTIEAIPYRNGVDVALTNRNQFILGPQIPRQFEEWNQAPVGNALVIAVHPSMSLTQVTRDGRQATCAGFMLDPRHPEWSDENILISLIDNSPTRDICLENVSYLGGRWILIFEDGQDLWLVNDAIGHRQVFFTDHTSSQGTWCASHPRVLAETLEIDQDEAAASFRDSIMGLNPAELGKQYGRWWPGIRSPYKKVRHLTPNHYLDLYTRRQHRYWPNQPIAPRTLESAVDEGASLLRNLMMSARKRFDEMTLMITKGWDSRLVLAASKDIAQDMRFVTLGYPRGNNQDVNVPKRLLPHLGLELDVAMAGLVPSDEFSQMYRANTVMPNGYYAANAEGLFPFFNRRRVAVTGIAAEAFCGSYRIPEFAQPFIKQITPPMLSALVPAMEDHPYAVEAFGEWQAGVGEIFNHDLLDLFYWEQRNGNWHSDYQLGFDYIWRDCFAPLNCRYLLEILMGVDKPLRVKPPAILHQRLMRALWPEVIDLEEQKPVPVERRVKESLFRHRKDLKMALRFISMRQTHPRPRELAPTGATEKWA